MTRAGGILGALALASAVPGDAQAQDGFGALLCLFRTECGQDTACTADSFTVEISLADHGDGLWLTYEGRQRAVQDVTPPDTQMMMFQSPGHEDNLAITVFPTGEAIHSYQDYLPGHGPRQQTAFGQCRSL